MKYQETGFRALYKNFAAFPLNDRFRKAMEGYPNVDDANCMLVYGYIDHEAGLTLEVLAAGVEREERFKFFDPSEDTRFFIRVGAVENEEFALFDDSDNSLSNRYSKKLEMLDTYDVDEEIEKTREMGFLDDCRHPHYPDDVQVYLMRDGLNPELCWSRIIGLGEHWIMGVLLNEPNQNFDYHQGEKIAFFVEKTEDEKIICYSDMNPSQLLKPEDLEDGSMLREAIAAFNAAPELLFKKAAPKTKAGFKEIDVKFYIPQVTIIQDEVKTIFTFDCKITPTGSMKAVDLLNALNEHYNLELPVEMADIERLNLYRLSKKGNKVPMLQDNAVKLVYCLEAKK